jgi:hypothetical protein
MDTVKTSLRSQADKWLAPTQVNPLRVNRFGRTANGVRYVCFEVSRVTGSLTIAFFQHGDGAWCVFPPESGRLEMRGALGRAA